MREERIHQESKAPVAMVAPPTPAAMNTCAAIVVMTIAVWGKMTYVKEDETPGAFTELHGIHVPIGLSIGYLITLGFVWHFSKTYLWKVTDSKMLLERGMTIYNIFQVVFNVWMVGQFLVALTFRGHKFLGDLTVRDSGAPLGIWWHYSGKYIEFFDTYFMLIRGNMKQFTFLHVYHHCMMPLAWWCALKYCPAGDSYFGALCNSFIHVLMYLYYTLKAWKVEAPWKRHLTKLQMVQFVLVFLFTAASYCITYEDIGIEVKRSYLVQAWVMLSLLVLFMQFYRNAYLEKKKRKKEKEEVPEPVEEQGSLSSESTDERRE